MGNGMVFLFFLGVPPHSPSATAEYPPPSNPTHKLHLGKILQKKFNKSYQKRIFFHLQAYNIYARKTNWRKNANRSQSTEKVGKFNLY